MIRILLVEDDENINEMLKYFLEKEGYIVETSYNIKNAKFILDNKDLVILDISLPDGNGLDFGEYISKNYNIPILFLTASDDEENMIKGLDIGHDYITKPFKSIILLSRIKNIINKKENNNILTYKNIQIDVDKYKVYKNDKEVELTALEYKILLALFQNINIVLTRDKIIDIIWDINDEYVNDNTLTVYIKRIRTKIDDVTNPVIIKTIRNIGYKVGD